MTVRVLTWNLQGRERPDLDAVLGVVRDLRPDVVCLQEVQRRQATWLAERLGWTSTWRFKHWPVVAPAEGLAVLAPEPPDEVRTVVLARFVAVWSWRRRIALRGVVRTSVGDLEVVDVHLGAGVAEAERVRQALLTAGAVVGPVGLVAGDLNAHPGSAVLAAFASDGLRDAWPEAEPGSPGPTNWLPGPRDGAPTQRLDYVLVGDGLAVVAAELPGPDEVADGALGALSDHLPLVVTVDRDR